MSLFVAHLFICVLALWDLFDYYLSLVVETHAAAVFALWNSEKGRNKTRGEGSVLFEKCSFFVKTFSYSLPSVVLIYSLVCCLDTDALPGFSSCWVVGMCCQNLVWTLSQAQNYLQNCNLSWQSNKTQWVGTHASSKAGHIGSITWSNTSHNLTEWLEHLPPKTPAVDYYSCSLALLPNTQANYCIMT